MNQVAFCLMNKPMIKQQIKDWNGMQSFLMSSHQNELSTVYRKSRMQSFQAWLLLLKILDLVGYATIKIRAGIFSRAVNCCTNSSQNTLSATLDPSASSHGLCHDKKSEPESLAEQSIAATNSSQSILSATFDLRSARPSNLSAGIGLHSARPQTCQQFLTCTKQVVSIQTNPLSANMFLTSNWLLWNSVEQSIKATKQNFEWSNDPSESPSSHTSHHWQWLFQVDWYASFWGRGFAFWGSTSSSNNFMQQTLRARVDCWFYSSNLKFFAAISFEWNYCSDTSAKSACWKSKSLALLRQRRSSN
jgi:hypothetical protein